MGFQQPAFISLVLVGMWVTSYQSGEGQKPAEWTMRLTGFHCRCSGLLEVNTWGSWKTVCRSGWNQTVTKMVCEWLDCGSPLSEVLEIDPEQKPNETIKLSCQGNESALGNCRWEKSNCTQVLTMFCKEPEKTITAPTTTAPEPTGPPRMRLVDGRFYCSGIVEIYMGGHWGTVQSSPENETELAHWVCRKIGCGDALEQKNRSFLVKNERQHLPVQWEMVASCGSDSIPDCFYRTRNSQDKTPASVICSSQNFKPCSAGVGAGTIVSILLALILLGVLIIICGPPAYKKLQKKYSKKQQRQWIGPTGLQQTVSFHRNSTVTLRPRQEGQGAQDEDNDYSQTPKKNSYLSAYPALEGAIRSSNPPDNSSDSDYDLHSARRL
ncbi:T-cell surface glycoprotein CD5 isoform X2 [Dermochelys coriacea]|uniref:T-cell surface glycoprotein CD5 isoform X2 n=1 Tax=Dermochelys coriacea TaxID=27794 RepID=UPI0018E8BF30|nr:T-cell surface glycoprotein CD5 isoform X2 [Dermochelys coriacea]